MDASCHAPKSTPAIRVFPRPRLFRTGARLVLRLRLSHVGAVLVARALERRLPPLGVALRARLRRTRHL
eukprot:2612315-Pleurochrysis_carterae.AAC.3